MTTATAEKETESRDLTTEPRGPLAVLRSDLEKRASDFRLVLPSHIDPGKFQRTILTAAQNNRDLLQCDRRSLIIACMKAAQDALLPDGREAVIVAFNHKFKDADGWHSTKLAQYLPMVQGLRKKILQSGEIKDLHAGLVYRQEIDAGRFVYEEGTERTLRHKPILEPDFAPSDDDIALAYSVAEYRDGAKSFEVLRRWEIEQIRETSRTGAQFDAKGNPRDAKGPWVDWFGEMAKKSVIRRHSKSLPMSGDILADVEAEDMDFAARSAVALLDSQKAAAPEPLPDETEDETGPDIKSFPDTAEGMEAAVTAAEAQRDALTAQRDAPEAPEKPPETQQAAPAPQQPQQPEPEPEPFTGPDTDAEPEPDYPAETNDIDEAPAETDEYGITKDANQALAEDFIKRAKRCELLADLRKLEREADTALAEMPGDIAAFVDEEFARARNRLTPPPKAR